MFISCGEFLKTVKGIVHPKIKFSWKCTHSQAVQDFKKLSISSLVHQWILCSDWLPSEWESKQLIKTSQWSTSNPHHSTPSIKGVIGCYMHFYKLFELKCVLAVCVHNHPIMIKIHPVFFFVISLNVFPFLKSSRLDTVCTGVLPQTRPEWAVISCFTAGANVEKNDS